MLRKPEGRREASRTVEHTPPASNGTEQRLDLLLDEVKALRADIARQVPPPPDGEVALREPLPGGGQKRDRRP